MQHLDEILEENYLKKQALVSEIKSVLIQTKSNHKAWQTIIQKVQELRDAYFEAGKVPGTKQGSMERFQDATHVQP